MKRRDVDCKGILILLAFSTAVLSVKKTLRGKVVARRWDYLLSRGQLGLLISQTARPPIWSGLAGRAMIGFLGVICDVKCVLVIFTQISQPLCTPWFFGFCSCCGS